MARFLSCIVALTVFTLVGASNRQLRGWTVGQSSDWSGDHCCADGPNIFTYTSNLNSTTVNSESPLQYYNGCEGWRCQCQTNSDQWTIVDLTEEAKTHVGQSVTVTCDITMLQLFSGGTCLPANASIQIIRSTASPTGPWPAPYKANCTSANQTACVNTEVASSYDCFFKGIKSAAEAKEDFYLSQCAVEVPLRDPQHLGGAFLISAAAPPACLSNFCIYGGQGGFSMNCSISQAH